MAVKCVTQIADSEENYKIRVDYFILSFEYKKE